MGRAKQTIPLKAGLWVDEGGGPRLAGSRCRACGELFFPRKENGICGHCQSPGLEDLPLSRQGRIYSHTVVMQRPPEYYKGAVPYGLGFVELPEGVRVETLFTGCDLEDLKVGMEVELVVEPLHEDEDGNEVVTYKFRPISGETGA